MTYSSKVAEVILKIISRVYGKEMTIEEVMDEYIKIHHDPEFDKMLNEAIKELGIIMENYCEYIHNECEYLIICKNYDNVCAKDMLGNYFRTEGYLPEDILARIKRYEEKEKLNNERI